jgi:hypothetical protein
VAGSTSGSVFHGRRGLISSVLNRPIVLSVRALTLL